MKDEEFVYKSDVRDKAITARSARHTRTHCGKGGRVRFPSDNLSKKELMKMNGEVKSYRLNSPMGWAEFKSMPDDLKVVYIQALRKKYKVPDVNIAGMLGIGRQAFIKEVNRLGVSQGKAAGGRRKWDKEGFFAWANGVDVPTPVTEEPAEAPVIEEAPVHFYTEEEREAIFGLGEEKGYVEDDLPFEEPDLTKAELVGLSNLVDELQKVNKELVEERNVLREKCSYWQLRCDELSRERLVLEKQMDVVRLIFGGKNNG